jgi:large subunit ribosomal protein L4
MAQITLKNAAGKDAGNVELDDAVFGVPPNVALMHQVVTAQLAHRRAGSQSTKTRSEVRGGGAKPYRQKGTGNARQGSTNAPHYTGGGVAFAPKPRDYGQKTPKKMIKAALRSALSDRANEGKVVVIDDWGFAGPRTKDAKAALAALGIEGRVLIVIESFETAPALSFRNLPEVQLIKVGELNAYDVLCNDWIVFEQGHLPTGEPVVTKPDAYGAVEPLPDIESDDRAPYGAGSHAPLEDGSEPAGYPIKGNADSMLYHVPGSSHYERTVAEVWFATAEAAEAAGFALPPSQTETADETADDTPAATDDTQSAETGGSSEHGEAQPSSEDRVDREADNPISEDEDHS